MYIGGIDIGTSGCKITLYDDNGTYICNCYEEYDVRRENGEQELDGAQLLKSVFSVIKSAAKQYPDLAVIGVTSFGESFVMLDENDNVLFPSMLYTDPRGQDQVKALCDKIGEDKLTHIAGVKPHAMFSLPKIMWIKENKPEIYAKARRILLMEDFVVYALSGVAAIDYALAARTLAFDIRTKDWSAEIFEAAGVDSSLMAKPVCAGTVAGKILPERAKELGLSEDVTIVTGAHDQVAAAVGAGVFEVGSAVDGTGTVECVTPCFDCIPDNAKLYEEGYAVIPYVFDSTYVCYALSYTGGAVLKWYRDSFARYEHELAKKEDKNVYAILDGAVSENPTGILILPHFAGAANPYMDIASKAAIIGLTLEHTGADVYKALMEGVTYEIMTNIDHLKSFGINLDKLYATGGGASSPIWLQIKADVLGRPIMTLDAKEAGACGTCMLCAVAVGKYASLQEAAKKFVKVKKTYTPRKEYTEKYAKYIEAYRKVYDAVRPIVAEIE